jgi:hypothetical protein
MMLNTADVVCVLSWHAGSAAVVLIHGRSMYLLRLRQRTAPPMLFFFYSGTACVVDFSRSSMVTKSRSKKLAIDP